MAALRAAMLALLVGCATHQDGCDGSDAERYAKALEPDADCYTLSYGTGKEPQDWSLCTVTNGVKWLCSSAPNECHPLGPAVKVRVEP